MKKKKLICIVLIILLILIAVVVIINYSNKRIFNGQITSFEYSFGSYDEGYKGYKIYSENDTTYFYKSGTDIEEMEGDIEIDNSVLTDISNLVKENNLNEWNGFNKRHPEILNGYSFGITTKYNDEKELKVYGYEEYPINYQDIHKKIVDYLENVKIEIPQEEIEEINDN